MLHSLRHHWPEYLIEAWGLGLFMVAAGVAVTVLEFPQSPVQQWLPDPFVRRAITGVAMGITAIAIIYSPWGKRSGAHINPAFTLAFFRLGKIAPWDAFFYILAQFLGGLAGVLLVTVLVRQPFQAPPVNYVVTVPGVWGWGVALVAEFVLSFSLMTMVLVTSNYPRLSNLTGLFAGILVA
ncbi:MAG: aquaporin, partial [Cyanobacteria bacterium P01_D01_bin.44]